MIEQQGSDARMTDEQREHVRLQFELALAAELEEDLKTATIEVSEDADG